MSLTVMDIEAKIPVYEIDGQDPPISDKRTATIRSHWNRKSLVVLVIDDTAYTVAADALAKAVSRCSGY